MTDEQIVTKLEKQVAQLTAERDKAFADLDVRDQLMVTMNENYTYIKRERDNLRLRIKAVDAEHEQLQKDRSAMLEPVTAMHTDLTTLRGLVEEIAAIIAEPPKFESEHKILEIERVVRQLLTPSNSTEISSLAQPKGEQCSYCKQPLTANHSFSYGFPGVPRVYKCDRPECDSPKGEP